MPLNFPNSPSTNDTYTFNGKTWVYDGTAWTTQVVPLTTANVTELFNLYYTDERVYSNVASIGYVTIAPRIGTNGANVSGNIAPTSASADQYNISGLTGNITILPPEGSPADGQKLILRIKDDGSSRGITWTTTGSNSYRVVSTTLPTTTTPSKVTYVGCIYNNTDAYWDVVASITQV